MVRRLVGMRAALHQRMSARFVTLSACAALTAAGCDVCIGTWVPEDSVSFMAQVTAPDGSVPWQSSWIDVSTPASPAEAVNAYGVITYGAGGDTGVLDVRLNGTQADKGPQQLDIILALPVTSGQVVMTGPLSPLFDPRLPGAIAYEEMTAIPPLGIRIDDSAPCGPNACSSDFAEPATGTFTIVSTAPLVVHVDATVTPTGGAPQAVVGDLSFPTMVVKGSGGYCVAADS
jgi:hypothetical protein